MFPCVFDARSTPWGGCSAVRAHPSLSALPCALSHRRRKSDPHDLPPKTPKVPICLYNACCLAKGSPQLPASPRTHECAALHGRNFIVIPYITIPPALLYASSLPCPPCMTLPTRPPSPPYSSPTPSRPLPTFSSSVWKMKDPQVPSLLHPFLCLCAQCRSL